ncbi:MAG: hypothetical protein K5899_04720 [Bacteroidaceae bacterium]|nr:hypothetical protein [Bacteroidaceae bacterium]
MKKMMIMAVMMVMTISANAMSYRMAKSEALFLSDKMAYELNLTAAQYEAVYEINLDYLMSVGSPSDAYGRWWKRRNSDLQYVLTVYQYNKYIGIPYFYRPISWKSDRWAFHVYNQYTNRKHFYKDRPKVYANYKGGNNRKADHFYADKSLNVHVAAPTTHHANMTIVNKGKGHINSQPANNRQIAKNTTKNHSQKIIVGRR